MPTSLSELGRKIALLPKFLGLFLSNCGELSAALNLSVVTVPLRIAALGGGMSVAAGFGLLSTYVTSNTRQRVRTHVIECRSTARRFGT